MDLEKESTVSRLDDEEISARVGCRILVPDRVGEVRPAEAKGVSCRSQHDAPQETVEAILADLWPRLAECRTAQELGAAIITAGVPRTIKRPVALAARNMLGKDWSEKTLQGWLSPRWHSEKCLASRDDAKARWRASPENREAARVKTANYYADAANRDRKRANSAAWYEANPDARRNYANARYRDASDQLPGAGALADHEPEAGHFGVVGLRPCRVVLTCPVHERLRELSRHGPVSS